MSEKNISSDGLPGDAAQRVSSDVRSLLDALRGDDDVAKRKAIEHLYAQLTPYARKQLGSKRDRADGLSESIVQSVIVHEVVAGTLSRVIDDAHLEARLRRAVSNKVIDRSRKRKPVGLPVDADGRAYDAAGVGPGPATQVADHEQIMHAARQLMAFKEACLAAPLSDTRRRMLELAIFEDLSVEEIAQRCETTVPTVKVRLSEARKVVVPHLLLSLREAVDGTKWAIIDAVLVQRKSVQKCCASLGVEESTIKHVIGCDVYPHLKTAYGIEGVALIERLLGNSKR
jgi:DNA-directed RNA polymerase specialized sigma24 family protein